MLFDFTLAELAQQLGVDVPPQSCLTAKSAAEIVLSDVSTDTRSIKAGDLFVALKGANFNGNKFAAQALASGAAAVLLDEAPAEPLDGPYLLCENAQDAYGDIAGWQRDAFVGPVVAMTGSAGKTTTKQLMASVLSEQFNTWMTQGNLNNHIGAPKTLLALTPEHTAAVVELGASGLQEIAYTAKWVKPAVGIITNASEAHLEGFGSLQGIVQTKGELIDFTSDAGTVVLNADDAAFDTWRQRAGDRRVVSFGFSDSADVSARDIELSVAGSRFVLIDRHTSFNQSVRLAFPGKHNIANALAVYAAARAVGMDSESIVAGLQAATPVSGRMKTVAGPRGITVLDDSYNANPASIRAAIDVLSLAADSWLVLGDMAELGEEAGTAHSDLGRYAKQQGIGHLLATGELSKRTVASFGDNGLWLADRDAVADYIKQQAPDHAVVLVKGSRSAGMEQVVRALDIAGE